MSEVNSGNNATSNVGNQSGYGLSLTLLMRNYSVFFDSRTDENESELTEDQLREVNIPFIPELRVAISLIDDLGFLSVQRIRAERVRRRQIEKRLPDLSDAGRRSEYVSTQLMTYSPSRANKLCRFPPPADHEDDDGMSDPDRTKPELVQVGVIYNCGIRILKRPYSLL